MLGRAAETRRDWTNETLSSVHGNGSNSVLSEVLGDLEDESSSGETLDLKGVEDRGEVLEGQMGDGSALCSTERVATVVCTNLRVKLDVDDGSDDGLDLTGRELGLGGVGASWRKGEAGRKRKAGKEASTKAKADGKSKRMTVSFLSLLRMRRLVRKRGVLEGVGGQGTAQRADAPVRPRPSERPLLPSGGATCPSDGPTQSSNFPSSHDAKKARKWLRSISRASVRGRVRGGRASFRGAVRASRSSAHQVFAALDLDSQRRPLHHLNLRPTPYCKPP